MPLGDPDPTDPMALIAHEAPGEPGAMERMAETLVDEYVRFGFDRRRLLELFHNPFYSLTHRIWRTQGGPWCEALIDRVLARYSPNRS